MRYRLFGRGTGLRVSELALGGALFGTAWAMGPSLTKHDEFSMPMPTPGDNFIDTLRGIIGEGSASPTA